jgi:hypothetical protein
VEWVADVLVHVEPAPEVNAAGIRRQRQA